MKLTLPEMLEKLRAASVTAPGLFRAPVGEKVFLPLVVHAVEDVPGKPRTLAIIGTDETPDRYNSVIKVDGWELDDYLRNPVYLWMHDVHQPPVGRTVGISRVEREVTIRPRKKGAEPRKKVVPALRFEVEFAPKETYAFADTVYRLYRDGFLKASSVGFQPRVVRSLDVDEDAAEIEELGLEPKAGWAGPLVFEKQGLLELSGVTVPANPNALVDHLEGAAAANERGLFAQFRADASPITEERIIALLEALRVAAGPSRAGKAIQTFVFNKKKGWTAEKATKWLDDHGFKHEKKDENEESLRYRQFDPAECQEGTFSTLTENFPDGVSAVACQKSDDKNNAAAPPNGAEGEPSVLDLSEYFQRLEQRLDGFFSSVTQRLDALQNQLNQVRKVAVRVAGPRATAPNPDPSYPGAVFEENQALLELSRKVHEQLKGNRS